MTTSSARRAPTFAPAAMPAHGSSTTIGVTGLRPRWSVTPWGAVSPWRTDGDGADSAVTPVLDWYVAADDRWHVPADEPTVRQRRVEGAPVVETRVRIPDGDVVQRIWAVPESGGTVVVEFENESPLPIAVSVAGMAVVTERQVADVPIRGIELPDDAIVLPVGHHATVRVLLPSTSSSGFVPVPPAMSVVRGWTRVVEQASRLVLPDEVLVDAVNAARCDLLLEGPVDPVDDPSGFLLDVAELVRCGDSADAWLVEIVEPVERVARNSIGSEGSLDRREVLDAVRAAQFVAARANDPRAAADLDRLAADLADRRAPRRWWHFGRVVDGATPEIDSNNSHESAWSSFADVRRTSSVGRFVRSIERRIVDVVDDPVAVGAASLLPGGVPNGWLGTNFEVHGLPTGPTTTVGFAVRWHGERPAVLWEQHHGTVRLTTPTVDPEWTTVEATGDALWAAPPIATTARSSLMVTAADESPAVASSEGTSQASSSAATDAENGSPRQTGILSVDDDGGSFA